MAYTKKYKRSYARRKRSFAKKTTVARVRRVVYGMAEKKWFEGASSNIMPATWGSVSFLNGLNQGNGAQQRIGNKILVHKIIITINLRPNGAVNTSQNGSVCRVAVYHNKECKGSLPGASPEIMDTDSIIANRYIPKLPQYTLLSDKTATMVVTSNNAGAMFSAAGQTVYRICLYPKQRIDFTATGGGMADILKHDFGLHYIADTATCCNISWRSQVIFSDI